VDSSSSSLFSPKQVAEALQVSESSVKRWCDQGLIPMTKTAGGHRRIPLAELLRFLSQSERPLPNPRAIGLAVPDLKFGDQLRELEQGGSAVQILFRRALASGDEIECRRVLQGVVRESGSVSRGVELLITDAMHRFGEAWERSGLDIYQERHACDICLRLIYEWRSSLPVPRGPVAIGGSPERDPYLLPTTLVELGLREAGWQAESLGTNLPLESIRRAVSRYRPRLVWISVSVIEQVEPFIERFNQFAENLPRDCMLIVGGRALTDAVRPRLSYTVHCDNLRQLVELAGVMRLKFAERQESLE